MITILIFLLVLITILLGIFKCRKSFVLFSFMTVITFFGIGCGIFSAITLPYIESIKSDNIRWGKRNVIILLGAGTTFIPLDNSIKPTVLAYSRINEAAKQYLSCKKSGNSCSIIVSGGDASKTGKSEAAIYQNELLSLGIDSQDILLEQKSMNTYQNAEYTSKILKENQFDTFILVTSSLHIKRSLLYFSNFGITPKPIIADYISPIITILPIGYNFAIADFIAHEYIGIARLHIYNYLGLNNH